jgi:hypothetical protein
MEECEEEQQYQGDTRAETPTPTKAAKKKLAKLKKDMITAEENAKIAEKKYFDYRKSLAL